MNAPVAPVAIVGTFDVRNFGDLLFPLVARWRLRPHGLDVVPYSPVGGSTGWADTVAGPSIETLLNEEAPHSAVLIGGGNIVHTGPARLSEYPTECQPWAYASLWLGATAAAAIRNIPVLWNAPGVPMPFDPSLLLSLVPSVVAASEYVSVRDVASRRCFPASVSDLVSVVPDTASDIAKMWPKAELGDEWRVLLDRKGAPPQARYFCVHAKLRSFRDGGPGHIAAVVDQHARRTGFTPLLIALGECHDDQVAARRVAQLMQARKVVVDDARGLRELAAAIAHSEEYVGCSLHGYITAASYGRPARIVAQPALPKQSGFTDHVGRPDDVCKDWASAFESIAGERGVVVYSPEFESRLDAHWEAIRRGVTIPREGLYVKRSRFIRALLARGISAGGMSWFRTAAS
jgi:hypothetical protein